jgi:hypothetical protein
MFCLNPNGTVSKIGDTVFNGGAEAPTGNIAITYNIATDGLGDNLTMKFTGTYTSQEDDSCYLSGFDLDDNPIYTNWSYTQTYLDEDSVTGNLYLNGTLAPNPEDYDGWLTVPEDADVLDPDNTFADSVELANIGGMPTILDLYSVYEETPQTVDFLNSGNLTGASLTTDGDSPLTLDGINSLGLGWAGWDYDYGGSGGAYYEQLWLNGNILQPSDMFPEWALNDDGSLNATAVLPAVEWGGNATLYIENISGNSMVAAGVVADDSDNSRSVLLVPAALAVDNNRDGNISFDVDDQTTEENPFVFWLNNDVDRYHAVDVNADNPDGYWIEDSLDPTLGSNIDITDNTTSYRGKVDWQLNNIPSERDLKDFARIWLNIGALQSAISSGNIYVGLKWVPPSGNTTFSGLPQPAIKLYVATEADGGTQYLTDLATAEDQVGTYITVGGNVCYAIPDISGVAANSTIVAPPASGTRDYDFVLPKEVFANLTSSNSTTHFLFEGCAAGQGTLSLVLLTYNGTGYAKIGAGGGSVTFDLEDIKNLYERWTVGQGNGNITESAGTGTLPAASANLSTANLPSGQSTAFEYDDDDPGLSVVGDAEENDYILFVHGFNVAPWERDAYAETMLKSLYWQGYKGKFGTFEWPTTYGYSNVLMPDSFDTGEYIAFASAAPLESLLGSLYSTYQEEDGTSDVFVMAHSHGNLVVGEALRMSGQAGGSDVVNTYVAAQAAVPSEAYDPSMVSSANLSFGVTNVTIPGYFAFPLSGNFGPDSADVFSGWLAPGNSTPAVGAKANFYNTNDWALNLWNTNEIIKPVENETQTFSVSFMGYSANISLWSVLEIAGGGFSGYITELPGNSSVYDMAPYGYTGNIAGPVDNSGNLFHKSQYWTSNNTLDGSNYTLYLDPSDPQGNLTNLPNRYDVMSFGSESRSLALGETNASIAGFGSQNLQSLWPTDTFSPFSYKSHPWHSAEFRFDAARQDGFWNELMKKFGITPNHNDSP